MADKRRHITGHISVYCGVKFLYRAVFSGRSVKEEEAAAYFVLIGRIVIKADNRKAAVSGNECGYALTNKRFKVFERFRLYCEPIIVGMRIYKSGRKRSALKVNDLIGTALINIADLKDSVILKKDTSVHGIVSCSVIDFAIFK